MARTLFSRAMTGVGVCALLGFAVLSASGQSLNPRPFINQPLVPDTYLPGGPAFTLTVNGTGFISGATVNWNGAALTTTFVSGSQLTAAVPATNVAVAGTAAITVVNPGPGGGKSNEVYLPMAARVTTPTLYTSSFLVGSTPNSLVVGDFNGDGILDFVTTNANDSSISVRLGNGNGTVTYNVLPDQTGYPFPSQMISGDFNGDGILDLAITNSSSKVIIALGVGDGTFTPQTPITLTNFATNGIISADFNGDGVLDLAVAITATGITPFGSVAILLGNGDGTFQLPVNYAVGLYCIAVATGDFNGDGILDLVTANVNDGTVSILLGNGNGTFQTATSLTVGAVGVAPYSVAAADFNGDGFLDFAVALHNTDMFLVYLGNGNGTFQTPLPTSTAGQPLSLKVADFNNDGIMDIANANDGGNEATIHLGNGDGTFQPVPITVVLLRPQAVDFGDFDGDGRLDLAAVESGGAGLYLSLQSPLIPKAQLSTNSLTFSSQAVNTTSAGQLVTVTNTGALQLNITSVSLTGTNAGDYALSSNTCVTSVASGANCTFNVTFTPLAGGARTASVVITDDDSNVIGATQTVSLSGTGAAPPPVTLSPSSLTFGSQNFGTISAAQSSTLTNNTASPLTITSIVFSIGQAFGKTTTCPIAPLTLAAGANCAINFTYSPTAPGVQSDILFVSDNAGTGSQTVALSGTGLVPVVSLSSPSIAFGQQIVTTPSATQTVVLQNTGNANLTISNIVSSADYTLGGNCPISPATLAPTATCNIAVTFTPSITGQDPGTITISDGAPGNPHSISLTGTGISTAAGSFSSPTGVGFPSQNVGTSGASQSLTLTNTGTGPMGSISISLPIDFTQTNTCPTTAGSTLAAGANCAINITFRPVHLGAFSGNLQVFNDSATNPLTVQLSGTGLPVAFAKGEVFFSMSDGTVHRMTPTGSLIQIMDTTTGSLTYGMAFDKAQNLYVADFGSGPAFGNVSKFDNTGNPLGFFGSGYGGRVEDVAFTSAGNLIAGSVDGDATIRIFDSTGAPVAQYVAGTQDRGIDWFDLASDQCTLYYTSEGTSIKRFDICVGSQLTDFVTTLPGSFAYALRFLPAGGLLVADSAAIERLDATGNVIQSYTATGEANFFGLNLDPDGTSFWTGGFDTGDTFKFDIASGTVLTRFHVNDDLANGFGIAVNGELTAATDADVALSMTALPNPVLLNSNLTYTLTATNNGPNAATNVTLTDTLPAGLTFVSATPSAGLCSGTAPVICNVGTLASTASATVTIVMTAITGGPVSNSASVTSDSSDPNPANNTATTNTIAGNAPIVGLSANPLGLPGTHLNQTCTPEVETITNIGALPLGFSSFVISGPFVISANTCPLAPATLASGASCAVSVTYVPTAVATQTGTLTITSNAANNPTVVNLTANGLPACFLAPNVPVTNIMRGADSASFTIAHQACSAAGPVKLSCSNQSPATCAFSPDTLTSPDTPSTLTVSNLHALTGDLSFQVHADASLEHLYTGISIDMMDFMMASAAATGSISAGETASYAMAVAPAHGLQGSVSFSCSGAPSGATCTVSPQSVALNGTGSSNVSVKVTTTGRSTVGSVTRRVLPPGTSPLGLMLLGMIAMMAGLLVWTKAGALAPARMRLAALAAGLIMAMVLTWAACGGTAVTPVSSTSLVTPSGTYTLTVTGTFTATGSSAQIVHNTTLTLTVH